MANRLGYVLLLTALTGSVFVTACGDDDAISGGEAGEPGVSGSPGDAGSGGSGGSGVSGSSVGGQGASAGEAPVAGSANAGGFGGDTAGSGGVAGSGEAGSSAEAGAPMGDGGTGGAPELVYACGTTTIAHKYCSAGASLNCADTPDCSDCVATITDERSYVAGCATCVALYDDGAQCGIDAFESGNIAEGFECFEGDGVYLTESCYAAQVASQQCDAYYKANDACPAVWPPLE